IGTGTPAPNAVINVNDWLAWSGQSLIPTNAGNTAYWKASAAGIAIESDPVYDHAGRTVQNTGLRFVRQGIVRASAACRRTPALRMGAYPVSPAPGAAAPTAPAGGGATWQTGITRPISAGTGQGGSGVATVVGYRHNG